MNSTRQSDEEEQKIKSIINIVSRGITDDMTLSAFETFPVSGEEVLDNESHGGYKSSATTAPRAPLSAGHKEPFPTKKRSLTI